MPRQYNICGILILVGITEPTLMALCAAIVFTHVPNHKRKITYNYYSRPASPTTLVGSITSTKETKKNSVHKPLQDFSSYDPRVVNTKTILYKFEDKVQRDFWIQREFH